MLSVFDNYALQYMLEQFPRGIITDLWNAFEKCCEDGKVVSEREVYKRLQNEAVESKTLEWCKVHSAMFKAINMQEAAFLGEMMKKGELDFYNNPQLVERRLPEGIPFILCIAKKQDRYYVYRKNTNTDFFPKVSKICTTYDIKYIEVETYLLQLRKSLVS